MNIAQSMLHAFWAYLLEASPWLLVGFVVAGAMHALVPQSLMQRWLGTGSKWAVARAAAIGVPLPLCSCSVIPTAAALRAGGASRGSSAAFAISTPEVDAPSIAITWGMIGPWLAIARPVAALVSALGVGWLIDHFVPERALPPAESNPAKVKPSCCAQTPAPVQSCCADTPAEPSSCCAQETETPHESGGGPLARAIRFALVTLPRTLALWILLGLALSALVAAIVPPDWFTQVAQVDSTGVLTKLAALVIGVPWYVCATASTPLAAALMAAGLSPGAALVFLLAGPATNPATMGWVYRDLGSKSLAIYLGGIAVGALGAGLLLDLVVPMGAIQVADVALVHDHATPVRTASAFALLALLIPGAVATVTARFARRDANDAASSSCCHGD